MCLNQVRSGEVQSQALRRFIRETYCLTRPINQLVRRLTGLINILTLDFQEGWQKLELVLLCGNRIRKLLAIIEWLQESLEAIVDRRHLKCHLRAHI